MEVLWNALGAFGAIMGIIFGWLTIARRIQKDRTDEKLEQVNANSDLEMKVKELEGKISSQYSELKAGLISLEKALNEGKTSNTIFENRILGSVDKIDMKMERIQDLVLKVFVSNNQNK